MEKIKNLLKQDNGWNAAVLSILIPFVFYYVLNYIVVLLTRHVWYQLEFMSDGKIQLVAIFLNLLFLRRYVVGKQYDKNGKVVLVITFVLVGLQLLVDWQS